MPRLDKLLVGVSLVAACSVEPHEYQVESGGHALALSEEEETIVAAQDSTDARDARETNLAEVRRALTPSAVPAFDALRARLPDDLMVYSSSTTPSQVLATATGDLLPAACRGFVAADSAQDFEAAVRCFLVEQASLMMHSPDMNRETAPDVTFTKNAPGLLPGPPQQYLRVEQTHRGYVVDERSMAFVFTDGRLTNATGRFAGTASFQEPAVDEVFLESEARRQFGDTARTGGLVYNPASGELELRVLAGQQEYRLNAADGVFRSSRSRVHALEVTKGVRVYQYPTSIYLGVGQSTSLVSSPVTCQNGVPGTCDVPGTGICRYYPRQSVPNADRAVWVQTVNSQGAATTIFEDDPCGEASVFNQPPWTDQYSLRHYAASARRILDEAADVVQHSESFFWPYPRTPMDYRLRVSQEVPVSEDGTPKNIAGEYDMGPPRALTLYQDPSPNGARQNARGLSTLAHEFGHYVHHTTSNLKGLRHVQEGWAAHYALRMATHRRFVSAVWPSVSYHTNLLVNGWTWQLQSVVRKGEYILDRYPNPSNCPSYPDPSGNTCADWIYYDTPYVCPDNVYSCGAALWTAYWVLVHDACRVSFLNCTNGQDIIQHNGGYQNSAWRLANSTFAYAIGQISPTGDAQEFMTLVASQYDYFRAQGYLSQFDLNRVLSVLAAQCLGPSQACSSHKLPGSPLPSSQTKKQPLFLEAEAAMTGSSYGGTATQVTATNGASQNKYVSLGSNGWIRLTFNIPQAGTYRVHFAFKPSASHLDEVLISLDPLAGWVNVGPMNTPFYQPGWDWRTVTDGSADLQFVTTGWKYLTLSSNAPHIGGFLVDAIWLEKL